MLYYIEYAFLHLLNDTQILFTTGDLHMQLMDFKPLKSKCLNMESIANHYRKFLSLINNFGLLTMIDSALSSLSSE